MRELGPLGVELQKGALHPCDPGLRVAGNVEGKDLGLLGTMKNCERDH